MIQLKNFSLFIWLLLAGCSSKSMVEGGSANTAPVDKNWKFETSPVWSDEFDTPGALNTSKWDYDTGGSGWGNNELEYYTNTTNNAKVENGKLIITARK